MSIASDNIISETELNTTIDTKFNSHLISLGLSKRTVRGIYYKYLKFIGEFDYIDPVNDIHNVLHSNFYDTTTYKYQTIGMLVHYYKYCGLDDTPLQIENRKLKLIIDSDTKSRNKNLNEVLPDLKEILKFNLQNFKNKKYKHYTINYLLINFCVRLLDLDCIISRDTNNIDINKNYLIIRKSSVIYYRNVYKTVKFYGPKKHIIKSKKIIDSLNNLLGDKHEIQLLETHNDLTKEIKKYTFNKINQSDYFKCVIRYKQNKSKNPLAEISRYANLRGTTIDAVLANYNIQL